MPESKHLFISYRSIEYPFTVKLNADLKNAGIQTWLDKDRANESGIGVGHDWLERLGNALRECGGLIAVLTKEYFESQYCRDELKFAYTADRNIFPIRVRRFEPDIMPDDINWWLRNKQWIDLTDALDEAGYQRKLNELVERIKSEERSAVGNVPEWEVRYLNTLIANLESEQGVENYIALEGRSEAVRPDPRNEKRVHPSFTLLRATSRSRPEANHITITDIHDAVNDHPQFVLIGDPGAGKTTTLRRLALENARERLEWLNNSPPGSESSPEIPLLVYLPRWEDEIGVNEFINGEWLEQTGLQRKSLSINRDEYLHIRLYLDGLNEMGGTGLEKAAKLRDWLNRKSNAPQHIIITCRKDDYDGGYDLDLPTVLVEPLSDEKIREFVEKYLEDSVKSSAFCDKVFPREVDNLQMRDGLEKRSLIYLARNPFMLAALLYIYEEGGDLPRNTGALVDQLVTALWERERLLGTLGWLPIEQMKESYGRFAFDMIHSDQPIAVPIDYFLEKLGMSELVNVGKSAGFVNINGDQVRFSHQLMLEYFAAVGLSRENLNNSISKPIMDESKRPASKWDEVAVALCGISSDLDSVLGQLIEIDPFLAVTCLNSGIEVKQATTVAIFDTLLLLVSDKNNNVRESAGDALVQLGTYAVPGLIEALHDEANEIRHLAAYVLGRIGDPSAVTKLVEALKDKYWLVRQEVARALNQIGDISAISGLLNALQDENLGVRNSVADALGNMGDSATSGLLNRLRDGDHSVRNRAAEALGQIGDATAVPSLLNALADNNAEVRHMVAWALGQIGDARAVPGLTYRLIDTMPSSTWSEERICDVAAESLEKIGTPDALEILQRWQLDPTPFMLQGLVHSNKEIRRAAVKALKQLGDISAVSGLIESLHDANVEVRSAAAGALGQLGDISAVSELLDALYDENSAVRSAAAKSLTQLGDISAVAGLLDALYDENSAVRSAAAKSLEELGDKSAVPGLLTAMVNRSFAVRYEATKLIDRFGDTIIPELLVATWDEDIDLRIIATRTLGRMGAVQATNRLKDLLSDSATTPSNFLGKVRVCDNAVEALQKIGTPEALDAVRNWQEKQDIKEWMSNRQGQ